MRDRAKGHVRPEAGGTGSGADRHVSPGDTWDVGHIRDLDSFLLMGGKPGECRPLCDLIMVLF